MAGMTLAPRFASAREPRLPAPVAVREPTGAGSGAAVTPTATQASPPRRTPDAERPSTSWAAAGTVRQLMAQLAPLLGLDDARIAFEMTEGSGEPHGAASAERIELSGDVSHPRMRGVVAHELAHVRQHENRVREGGVGDATSAESEAAGIAAALESGRLPWVPRARLPAGRSARDSDAQGITTTRSPATTPDVAQLERQLDDFVAINHTADVRMLVELLDHPWTQNTPSMVENALRILSGFSFVIARALVRAVPWKDRRKLAQLNDDHHAAYPESCIAVLSALTANELTALADTEARSNGTPFSGVAAALHNVQPDRLSPIARRALLATLRRAGSRVLSQLVDGDRRVLFRVLLESAPDAATDEAELRTAITAERLLSGSRVTSDGILLDRLEKLLRAGGRENARAAITALSELAIGEPWPLSQPASDPAVVPTNERPNLEDLRRAIAAAPTPAAGTNAPLQVPDALIGLVEALDGQGLIEKLVEGLDEQDRRTPDYGRLLRAVLAARSPAVNVSHAIELLSYGLFDWAVRDGETRLAYLLVRSLPIQAQDTWRQLDNGKWFGRLLSNLPKDMWDSGEYTGVGSEYSTGADALGVPETMLIGYARSFLDLWSVGRHEIIARLIVRQLLGLDFSGHAKAWIPGDAEKDLALRTAVVRRLDALQGLNAIIEKLPDTYLLGEQTRQEVLELNLLRDPVHLVRQALALMPGFFESITFGLFTFTPHDAWIALQALRALPPAAQVQFTVQNPSVWSTFWGGLTAEMRRALPSTLATGRDARLPTQAALRGRLSDERLWTEARAPVLRALVDLAIAADDRSWVFELSRRLRVDLRLSRAPLLTAVLKDFGLFNEAEGRTVFKPRRTDTSHWPSGWRMLGMITRGLGLSVYHLMVSDTQFSLMGKTMHVKGFDLSQLQWALGGDIADGVTLAGSNHIDVEATFDDGFIVNLDLPHLDIAGVNMVLPGKTYRSGPISITGFHVSAGFSDRGYTKPSHIAAKLGALDVRDFVIVDPALPLSGAWAVANLGMNQLGFNATPDGASDPSMNIGRELPEGTIPIPVFGPLFQLLSNIVSLHGSIPGDCSLLDYARIPLKLPFPVSSVVDRVAKAAGPVPQPLTHLWGLASDGVLRPPYSAAQRITDSTAMLRAFNVAFERLEVHGISIGSGQQIASLVLEDVNVTVGQSLPAYLRAALATVQRARERAQQGTPQRLELERREEALQKQLDAALGADAADELRLQELEGKDRWDPGSLKGDERAELVRLTRKLRSDTGLLVEIGSITLGPLSGTIQSLGVTLKGIHVSAKLPNVGVLPYTPGYLDDQSLIDQFMDGSSKVPTIGELAKTSEFHLEIEQTTLVQTDPAQPAVVLKADKIPTAEALKAELVALPEIEGNRPIRERLAQALSTVTDLEAARKSATSAAAEPERLAAAQAARVLTDRAERLLGTEIGGLTFGRITGELDPSGKLTISLNDVAATAIAGRGFAIAEAVGTASVGLSAGNLDPRIDQVSSQSPESLVTQLKPSFGLSGLTVSGIHLPGGSIGRVSLGKLTGTLETNPQGYRVPDLAVDHIEVAQVAMGQDGDGILAEQVSIDGLRLCVDVMIGRPAGGESTVTGAFIPSLSITSLTGLGIAFDSPETDGSTTHVAASRGTLRDIRGTDIAFAPDSKGWQLVRARATAARFEDVAFDLAMGALTSRATVKGTASTTTTRREGQPSFSASYALGDGGSTVSLRLRDLIARGTDVATPDGSLSVRSVRIAADYDTDPQGGRATTSLSDLVIGPIRWRVGTVVLSGKGPLTAGTVTLAAVRTAPVPVQGKKPEKPAAWSVTDVVITKLEGRGLNWTDKPVSLDLSGGGTAATGDPPLRVGRIHLRPAKKSFELSDLAVNVEGKVADTLEVQGGLVVDFLSVEVLTDDRLHAIVRGVSGSAALSGEFSGTIGFSGLQGAAIDVGSDAIRIGSDDPAEAGGLFIEQLTASSLDVNTVLDGQRVHLFTQPTSAAAAGGRIDFVGIRALVRIDKQVPPVKGKSLFRTLAFEKFSIDRVVLDALQVDLPDDDVTIVIPAAAAEKDETYLRDVELVNPIGTDPTKVHPDFTVDLDTWKTEGTVSIAEVSARVSATIKNKFSGDVHLGAGLTSIRLFAGGGFGLDIMKPLATMQKAARLGRGEKIHFSKFGANSVSMRGGVVRVEKPFVADLEYTREVNGVRAIWIKVKAVDLEGLSYGTARGGDLNISSLRFTDAFFSIDLAALSKGPAAPKGVPTEAEKRASEAAVSFDPRTIRPVLNELEGFIGAELFVSTDVGGLKDIHIGTAGDPLTVPIEGGEVDIPRFEGELEGAVSAKAIGGMIGPNWTGYDIHMRPWILNTVADDPMLAIHGNQLRLGVYISNPDWAWLGLQRGLNTRPDTWLWRTILAWDLRPVDLDRAWDNRFSLWSAIFDLHSDPATTQEDLAAMSGDEREQFHADRAATQATRDSLEVRTLKGALSVRNQLPILLPISSDAARGSLVLSKDAFMDLTFDGGIPAVSPPTQRAGQNPSRLNYALKGFSLDSINLTLYDNALVEPGEPKRITGSSGLGTGRIDIQELTEGSLSFINLFQPGKLTGTISKGHAENISWFSYGKPPVK